MKNLDNSTCDYNNDREYQALAQQQEENLQAQISHFEQQQEDDKDYYQALAEQQESDLQAQIEHFEQQREEYQTLGEQQENAIQALIDQYESQLFSTDPTFVSTYEKASDDWFIINEDYSLEQSDNHPNTNNKQYTIHKKFHHNSKSGKTPYFSYHILDDNENETNLKIGNYSFSVSEPEHWVSWQYFIDSIEKTSFYKSRETHPNEDDNYKKTIFPIDYSFADIVQLDKYNPFEFNFTRLSFLKQESETVCGDKFATIKIIGSNNQFLVLSIFNLENNIVDLLKQLNDCTSFSEFLLKSHLTTAVKYLSHMQESNFSRSNFPMFSSYLSIIKHMGNIIDQNYKFLHKDIKHNQESDINILLSTYYDLKKELDSFI
jgi:hypothetical protein